MTNPTPSELVRSVLDAAAADLGDGFALAERLGADAGPDRDLATVLSAAALAGGALGSVEAAAAFTRARTRPRPLPGVERAVDDPFSQTVLGLGLIEAQGAIALVLDAAAALDVAETSDEVSARTLAAFDVAAGVALQQAEQVWEVVGTSGSATRHGFQTLWERARALSAAVPRGSRRRAVGRDYLAAAAA